VEIDGVEYKAIDFDVLTWCNTDKVGAPYPGEPTNVHLWHINMNLSDTYSKWIKWSDLPNDLRQQIIALMPQLPEWWNHGSV
jgi:hypothetical protein